MLIYLIKRLFSMLITLVVASMLIFSITQLLPGDVAQMILGETATPETLEALRGVLGLNDPIHTRYIRWIANALQGDLGESLSIPGIMVADLLLDRVNNSLFLATIASIFIIPLSLLLGTIAGLRKNKLIDKIISLGSMAAISIPEFVSGIMLILVFSLYLGILPASSSIDLSVSLWHQLDKMVLPILTISFVLLGYTAKMTRASVIEVSNTNYIKTAIFKGLSDRKIIVRHILRNALIPSITVIAMNIGWMIGGLVIVETVFAYPGVGSLLLYGINNRDVPLIQNTMLMIVAMYMVLNLLSDILYVFVNPNIKV